MPEGRFETLVVGPVDPSDLSRIMRRVLGWAPAWPRVVRIAELSQGNPLHALELARAFGASGRATVWRARCPTAFWSSPVPGSRGCPTGCATRSAWPRSRETPGWTCSAIWTPRLSTSGTHSRRRRARGS